MECSYCRKAVMYCCIYVIVKFPNLMIFTFIFEIINVAINNLK